MSPMHDDELQRQLKEYADLILKIRELSSVPTDNLESGSEYEQKLIENFLTINGLAVRSRQIVEDTINPLLTDESPLEDGTASALQGFCALLLDPFSEEDLDLTILYEVSKRLLGDAMGKLEQNANEKTHNYLVKQLYVHINCCYANVNRTNRIKTNEDLSRAYRDDGLRAAKMILDYLKPELFVQLNQECRRDVLIHSRFYLALYDTFYVDEKINEERLEGLWKSFALSEDPFFLAEAGDYDWNYHRLRCLENMGQLTERGNSWEFSPKQLRRILEGVDLLEEIWNQNPVRNEAIVPGVQLELIRLRADYFNQRITKADYQEKLIQKYEKWANDKYDMYSVLGNIFVPVELLTTLDGKNMSERMEVFLNRMYRRLVDYILHSSNTEAFSFLLEYLSGFMEQFVETPGGMTFEEMGLSCLAAIHPPTYVHSLQVAQISRCLCRHLLQKTPEVFVGAFGCRTKEEVWEHWDEILYFMYHGALCHDFGKIAQLDTIFVYGRDLTEGEFEVIQEHPRMGAFFLEAHPSTREYVDLALNHHLWYDGSGGYPLPGVWSKEENRIFCDILTVADCVDAASYIIGRNYNQGKSLDEVCKEIQSQAGTRYSPVVAELFQDAAVMEDLKYLVGEGCLLNYRNTYLLLHRHAGNKDEHAWRDG